jgi:hypothetical protein
MIITPPPHQGPTLSPSVTSESLDTSTPVPALPTEDAYRAVADLLQQNPDCRLPCWWGLTPGQSTPATAYETLLPFRNIAYDVNLFPIGGSISLAYPLDAVSADIRIDYQPDPAKSTIRLISVDTQAWREGASLEELHVETQYHELFRDYSIQSLLQEYGPPEQVLVRGDIVDISYTPSSANDLSPETLEITLLYPEQGIFARYNMLAERAGERIRGCPNEAFVELWLLSPDEQESYDQTLSSLDMTWEGNWPYSKPIQGGTQMTLDEFYEVFKEPTDQCVETPINIWPSH